MSVLSRLRHPSRAWLINGFLTLAVALVGLVAYRAVAVGSTTDTGATRTTTVDSGTVTSTVTSSGNIAADRTLAVDFEGSGGIVTAIFVKPGDVVHKGQRLALVDATSSRQALASAQVQLESAEASYDAAVQGQTPQERAADQQSIASAQVSIRSAELSLRQSRQTAVLDRRQKDASVAQAEQSLKEAQQTTPVDHATVETARTALGSARQTRAATVLADRHQVESQEQALSSARQQLASTKATVAVSEEPARASSVAQAQSQVDSARIGVREARSTLAQVTLRAPEAGRVAAVNGTVGQSSSSSSSSDASTSSDSTSSTSSGFVSLVSARTLEVTADVAESDIDSVKVGQSVAVTLSADDKRLKGTVAEVADASTVTNNVVEYAVTVRLDRTKGVRLGQTAQLVVTTGEKQSVLRVSSSALTTIGKTTTATVRSSDGSTVTRQVTTGLKGDTYTEVLSGLQAGDIVVLPTQSTTGSSGFSFPSGGGPVGGGLG